MLRDKQILDIITKFRFALSRQIMLLANFTSMSACNRRLKKLLDEKLIEKRRFLYGVAYLYFATPKAKRIFNLPYITKNIRIEQIRHDIYVIDTAIYYMNKFDLSLEDITTDRELKNQAGFGNKGHTPDLVFTYQDTTYCIEIELSVKSKEKLYKNISNNYLHYDVQIWITDNKKVKQNLEEVKNQYEIQVADLKGVMEYVNNGVS